jgi:antitoxin component YwqK of YwqJK toxin-antitoxin module
MIHLNKNAVLKLFLKTILFIVFILFTSCAKYYSDQHIEIKEDGLIYKVGRDNPFTGRIIDTVENKIVEYDVVEGLKNGEFRISSIEGIVTIKGNVEDNMNIGEWNYFYSNGQLESKGYFNNDLPEGKWVWFHLNGNLKETGTFVDGVKIGRWYQYNSEGNLVLIIYYDFGEIIEEVKIDIMRST